MKVQRAQDVQLALKTEKENQTGLLSNDRLLVIKAGIISYFSQVPKKFKNTKSFDLMGRIPKYTIPASDIDRIDIKDTTLTLLFKKSKLINKNQFTDLVKGNGDAPERSSDISQISQNNGFTKWIFTCQDKELLNEFYYLVNLFRTSNPKFKPNLLAYVSEFQGKKKNDVRQMSMKPVHNIKTTDFEAKRLSEIPKIGAGGDLFFQSLGLSQKPKSQPIKKEKIQQMKPKVQQKKQNFPILDELQVTKKQNLRLSLVKNKIQINNQPNLSIIGQQQNEDKLSELSKNLRDTMLQKKTSLKHTTSEMILQPQPQPFPEIKVEQILQQPKQQPTIQIIERNSKPIQQSNANKIQNNLSQKQMDKKLQVEQHKQIKKVEQQPIEIPIEMQQVPKSMTKKKLSYSNYSINSEEFTLLQERKERNRKKIFHFMRAFSNSHFNTQNISKKLKITEQELNQIIRSHSKQQESGWGYIQNNLSQILAKGIKVTQLHVNEKLIEKYHVINQISQYSRNAGIGLPLEDEISIESYHTQNQQQIQALKWIEQEIQEMEPKPFSSKIFKKTHFKIYIRSISFKKEDIIKVESGWIINKKGHLQQFLANLRLQKVLKQLSIKITSQISITCAQAIYIRYKQYQGLAKRQRVGYSCLPLKSIKGLELITRSKQMMSFQKDFPQFTIFVETIKQGLVYKLHLERILEDLEISVKPLQAQLKKLTFTFDNELDLFYINPQYIKIEDLCLDQIQKIIECQNTVTQDSLYKIMEHLPNNISVHTLCKLLGCRIDKKGQIFFHHTILRLGGRQFGQQLSLIKRAKKRGNIQLGRDLCKRVMSRLQFYRYVTPMSHFIQIYLHIIDLMIVEQGELHKAIPILHKVLVHLSEYEVEQYSVYLALLRTYLKLSELQNFIKTLQNCRLFLFQTFRQYSLLIDYPFQRIIMILLLKQDTEKALAYNNNLMRQLSINTFLPEHLTNKYLSKVQWDKNNMLLQLGRSGQAYRECQLFLIQIEKDNQFNQDYWIEGVLCLSKCWLEVQEVNAINGAQIQKRVQRAIQLSFSRQNLEMVYVLFELGQLILQKCEQFNLPRIIDSFPSFEHAKIEFNETKQEVVRLLAQKQ